VKIPDQFKAQVAAFPAPLRKLIETELKAGNTIVELASCFPAPPAGAYVKLANPVTTRPRKTARGVYFYDRNSSSYSGEFTDARRFYFVLEPPNPTEPEPDMNDIRDALEAKHRAADAELYQTQRSGKTKRKQAPADTVPSPVPPPPVPARHVETAVDRFRESMVGTYERWHDGIGYDLDIFKTATPNELVEIENLLLSRGTSDWRDVEALAALNSPRARVALRKALKSSDHQVRMAVTKHAASLVTDAERTASLVQALAGSEIYGGLTQALLQVEEFHPPEVIEALFCGALSRKGDTAVHFAAMLMFLHGQAKTSFDWELRPFFLRFNTENRVERKAVFRELCAKVDVLPEKFLLT